MTPQTKKNPTYTEHIHIAHKVYPTYMCWEPAEALVPYTYGGSTIATTMPISTEDIDQRGERHVYLEYLQTAHNL